MPELPEVETIVRQLNKTVKNEIITDFWTDSPNNIKGNFSFAQFVRLLKGRKILEITRKGKNILFALDRDFFLWVHLKLTGHFLLGDFEYQDGKWEPRDQRIFLDPQNRFLHWVFTLKNGQKLALSDMRKFVRLQLLTKKELQENKDLNHLGPDPLSSSFTFKVFLQQLQKAKGEIKLVLMDQRVISGLGNIYANEVLWRAKIHPLKEVSRLQKEELRRLFQAIKQVLTLAVKYQGTSAKDESYRQLYGQKGNYAKFLKVYQREGQPCPRCGTPLKRFKQKDRSSFYCPHCQIL